MTVNAVADSQSKTAAYSDPTTDRRAPNIVSDRNAASSKPMTLASLSILPFIITGAAETLGDLVDRQDAFNGAEGSIEGDTIKLKAESQNDAGLSIKLTKPISGRISFSFNGSDKAASDNNGVTVQFIKAGANYDYTNDKILAQQNIKPFESEQQTHFAVPEGTDKIVVMKVGRGSFDVKMSDIRNLNPVAIPTEAICEALRDGSIKLLYYPGVEYNSSSRYATGTTTEIAVLPNEEHSKDYVIKSACRGGSSGGSSSHEIELNLTKGTTRVTNRVSMGPGYESNERLSGAGATGTWPSELKKEFISNLGDLIKQLKPSDAETPPEIQNLIKLLENYIAKHKDGK
ncbi:MAG: hypothetical protein WC527_08445 [Candidatus Margulisiibacteriota bacterium]